MELILFGGIFWWLIIAVWFVAMALMIEANDSWHATWISLVCFGALWWATGGHNPFPWLGRHWQDLLMGALAYFVLGGMWSIIKWWFYLHKRANYYEENIKPDLEKKWSGFVDSQKAAYKNDFKNYVQANVYDMPPDVKNHKGDIMMWMCWWPMSLLGSVFSDLLHNIFQWIYRMLSTMLANMAKRVFAGRFQEFS